MITTSPSVVYKIEKTNGESLNIHNPSQMPDVVKINKISEPIIKATILLPDEYLGAVMQLCTERRGIQKDLTYVGKRAMIFIIFLSQKLYLIFMTGLNQLPADMQALIMSFRSTLKINLVKVQILQTEPVDALSFMCHRSKSASRGKVYCEKLKDLIPRQQFKIPLQATIGGKIIARETINSFRKDVTAKLYGGDVTRKNKLLDKQKKGKKRMRQFGKS